MVAQALLRVLSVFVILSSLGCGSSDVESAAPDSGRWLPPFADAGSRRDGGPSPLDAGALDAGLPTDAGSPPPDAGVSPADGGAASWVRIAAPTAGAAVASTMRVSAQASADVTRVELYVDGRPQGMATTRPFEIPWDATAHENPLPAPTHEIDFGYYFVDGRYGDFRAEVNPFTNLYYAWAWRNYPTDQPWAAPFALSLENASREGRRIHLNVQDEEYWDEALDIAQNYWDEITRVELADEPGWDRAETEAVIGRFRANLHSRGLGDRPLGIVYTRYQLLNETGIFADGLDWVGIEAYVDPPGSPDSAANLRGLQEYVRAGKARVPADKQIVLVMMAYDRNGGWRNLSTLVDLQAPTYLLAYDDPRVMAITLFSYGRPGGSHDHPELRVPHKQIAERILGITIPSLANGPKTLEVKAFTAGGLAATDTAQVTVAATP